MGRLHVNPIQETGIADGQTDRQTILARDKDRFLSEKEAFLGAAVCRIRTIDFVIIVFSGQVLY